ncbi:MAG: hypothetical protein HEP71_08295 [Roseivirga sp.]|nr:hypothetical protein [Roseivirga sp.]
MDSSVNIELLEKYLAGEISADQVLDDEGNVLTRASLELAIDEYNDVVIHLEGAALKDQLRAIQTAMAEESPKRGYRVWFAAAAAVLILLTAGLLWRNANQAAEFEDYFSHFNQLVSFRGEAGNRGIEAYSRKNYEEAFQLLSTLEQPELSNELKFYLGVSALGSDHEYEAIAVFTELGIEKSSKYYQQIRWYLALAYWKNNEPIKAISLLEGIENGQYKFTKAQELIALLR